MRSALIIGAGGQDGRLLAPFLSERGYAVHGWVRQEPTVPLLCEHKVIDLLNPISVIENLKTQQPNEIYYLAAFHDSTESLTETNAADVLQRSFDIHVTGLINVLKAMASDDREVRLFYAASSHVFGVGTIADKDESSPLRPSSAYAISKTAGLRCCQLFRKQERMFVATGILFNHESSLRKSSFVSQKIVRGALKARRDKTSRLPLGDVNASVDWGYAPDYVDAMFRILQLAEADDFVIASGKLHSVGEFAEIAFEEVGLDWQDHVDTNPELLKRAAYPFRGDSTKLRAATGWSPSVNFTELVTNLVHQAEKSDEVI